MSADVKSPKPGQGQASAQPDADDEPQGVAAPAAEQGAPKLVDAKPAIPAAAAQTADKGVTPAHRPSSDVAAKSDAPQTFDDLLNAPTTQTGAASNGLAAATANQTGSAPSVAAASNAPAPQNLLGPVPLSGIPVLIAGKALAGSNQFDIRLDPPELGRIEVRLKIDRDGQVSSHLIADRADTLALLRSDQTGLERALQDAGLKTAGDGLQFSLRDQGGNAQPDGRSASPNLLVQDNSNPIPDLPMRGYVAYATRAGGIDIHV
jgi:chemotaxis protein MotD